MDSNSKIAETVTPVKETKPNRSKSSEIWKISENSNPNFTSPNSKIPNPPAVKSATKSQKSSSKNPYSVASPSPRKKIRERKFVVAKKNTKREKSNSSTVTCKCKIKVGGNSQKCLCLAYETLRASQEEFFKNRCNVDDQFDSDQLQNSDGTKNGIEEEEMKNPRGQNLEILSGYDGKLEKVDSEKLKNRNGTNNGVEEEDDEEKKNLKSRNPEISSGYEGKPEKSDLFTENGSNNRDLDEIKPLTEMGSSMIKRSREKLLEEAREKVPETGSGRVFQLVKAFEKLYSNPNPKDSDQKDEKESEDDHKVIEWALPGLQQHKAPETDVSSSSFCPSDFFLTSEILGLSSSLDSSRESISSRTSGGGRNSRRNSSDSCGTFGGRRWKRRQLKATSLKPFKLRTEQRGRQKEEEFTKKVQQIMTEEEKQRIPIAQGLPWTTDEPEYLVKPPVKEITRPVDLVLHSDIRAVDRAGFDHQVAEKMTFIEQYRMERERQQKLAEEEEIRRLRKELIPRAQPMPYFDRPFLPRRSVKNPTMPREPKFNLPQHKKIKCSSSISSWSDMYTHYQ